MHNIPFGMMNKVHGEMLGNTIGEIIEIDVDKDGVGWGPFLWVRVQVDIKKPLLRGNLINPTDEPL